MIERCDVFKPQPVVVENLGNGRPLVGIELEHPPNQILASQKKR